MRTRNKVRSVIAMAAAMLMVFAGMALASDLDVAVIDADGSVSAVTLTAGGEKTFTINLEVTGRQANSATFKIYKDWTLQADGTFVGSNEEAFNVPARLAGDPAWTATRSGKVSVAAGVADRGPDTLEIEAHDIVTSSPAALSMRNAAEIAVTVVNPVLTYSTFQGFGSPVNNTALNTIKGGQAVPLKWRLLGPDGSPVLDLSGATVKAVTTSCTAGLTIDPVEEIATGKSGLQNLGDGYYQFNWSTPKATGCRTLTLDIPGHSFEAGQGPATLMFQLR